MNSNKQKKSLKRILRESIIIGFFIWLGDILNELVRSSVFSKISSSYGAFSEKLRSGFLYSVYSRLVPTVEKKQKLKMKISAGIRDSFVCTNYRALVSGMLGMKISTSAIGFLAFGIIILAAGFIASLSSGNSLDTEYALTGVVFTVVSLPMMTARLSWGSVIAKSRTIGGFLCYTAGFREIEIDHFKTLKKGKAACLSTGIAAGIIAALTNPVDLIVALLIILAAMVILYKPEVGCLVCVGILPFVSTLVLCASIGITLLAYAVKIMCGKRSLKLGASDIAVLFFAINLMFAAVSGVEPASGIRTAAVLICLISLYFMISNLIASPKAIRSLTGIMIISMAISAVFGIYQYYFGTVNADWFGSSTLYEAGRAVTSSFDNPNIFASYIILTFPLLLSVIFSRGKGPITRAFSLLTLCAAAAALVFTRSTFAAIACVVSIAVVIFLMNKKIIIAYIAAAFILPAAAGYLPESVKSYASSIFSSLSKVTEHRTDIWSAAAGMIKDNPICGIGIGEKSFSTMYSSYSSGGVKWAPHSHSLFLQIPTWTGFVGLAIFIFAIFLVFSEVYHYSRTGRSNNMKTVSSAALCGIFAALIMGLTCNIWYNFRLFAYFWIIAALAVAAVRCGKKDDEGNDEFEF